MVIAVLVGLIAGTVGSSFWALIQLMLNAPGFYDALAGNWYLIPLVIAGLAAGVHSFARVFRISRERRSPFRRPGPEQVDRRQPLADLVESYHFGVPKLNTLDWLARSVVSLAGALFGGIFGLEGAILEATYSAMPALLRKSRLLIEEKQTFVACTIASSLAVALSAPFAGILLTLELLYLIDAKVRWNSVVTALVAYGVATFWQATLFSNIFVENTLEPLNVVSTLFAGLRPLSLGATQWVFISMAAALLGGVTVIFSAFTTRMLSRGSEFFTHVFGRRIRAGMLAAGGLISLSVWLVPESLGEASRLWEDMAWLRLSSVGAITVLLGLWGIFVIAFSGWGSSGVFSPMLVFGALLGYGIGNAINSQWAVPLAISTAISMFAVTFRAPLAAIILGLEIGHGGAAWWLSALAVIPAAALVRLLDIRPLHESLLERRGIRIVGGRAANVLSSLKAGDAMHRDVRTVTESATLKELREVVATSNHGYIGVLSSDGKYLGLLPLEQLPYRIQRVLGHDAIESEITIVDRVFELRRLIDPYNPTVLPTESLERALQLLQDAQCVAVVDENRSLAGLLFESSIATRYRREIASFPVTAGTL